MKYPSLLLGMLPVLKSTLPDINIAMFALYIVSILQFLSVSLYLISVSNKQHMVESKLFSSRLIISHLLIGVFS